ncbi:MAG: hypothetical protein ACLTYW_00620 [Collinsella sp.]
MPRTRWSLTITRRRAVGVGNPCRGQEVIVSRGELVEIGGSFRIPDVMAASGAKLVEVGATNRTHLATTSAPSRPNGHDLEGPSFQLSHRGFHGSELRELAALAHKHGLLFYEDQGSGALLPDDILVAAARNHAGFGFGRARFGVVLGR